MRPAPDTLPERLRAGTAEAHALIERRLDWTARLASHAAYAGWLAGLYGVHVAWEGLAGAHLAPGLLAPRRRAHWIAEDLLHLGWTRPGIARLPLCPLPAPGGRAAAMGMAYVIEGSTLGGLVIAGEVERRLGLGAEGGCRYFRGHGRRTGALWREVKAELAALPEADGEDALRAALGTFEALLHWLDRPPAAPGPRVRTMEAQV